MPEKVDPPLSDARIAELEAMARRVQELTALSGIHTQVEQERLTLANALPLLLAEISRLKGENAELKKSRAEARVALATRDDAWKRTLYRLLDDKAVERDDVSEIEKCEWCGGSHPPPQAYIEDWSLLCTTAMPSKKLRLLREKARWAEKTADYLDGNDLLEPEIELMAKWRALTKEPP